MKDQKLIRCMLMTLLVLMAGMLAQSQSIIQSKQIASNVDGSELRLINPDIDMANCDVFQDDRTITYVPKPKQKIDWDNMVNVTFQMEYDETLCESPTRVSAYPIDFFSWGNGGSFTTPKNSQDGTFKGEFGAGLWDLFVEFPSKDGNYSYFVLKECVDIHSDTTIVIDQKTSTNPMKMILKMPNGDVYDHSKQTYGEYMIIDGMSKMSFVRISDGIRFGDMYFHVDDEDGCCFINDVSDRFFLNYQTWFTGIDSYFLIDHTSLDFSFPLENDPADWECIEESFQPSAIDDREHNLVGMTFTSCHNGLAVSSTNVSFIEPCALPDGTMKIYVNAPKHSNDYVLLTQCDFGYGVEAIYNYEDGNGNIVFTDTVMDPFMIYGAPTFFENGVKHYINNGPLNSISFMGFNEVDGLVARHGYPGNPAFSFTEDQKTSDFGSGTPICLFLSPEVANVYPIWSYAYFGRYGEDREVDALTLEMSMAVNGTEVCTNFGLINQYLMEPDRPTGEIDITMTNENIMVDGLQGRNFAQMHIDENSEDSDSPSLSMLWFKDNEDRITDRFATSQDGLLEFSAGDFNAIFDIDISENTWLQCQKPEVEVSYAPYGEDNWDELAVEEIPENFYMPCFGHFYRGSLGGVKGKGLQGWFDLKIRLEDAAGNWQEQVISPAFRIDDQAYSSVATVGSNNAHEVARYNLAGQRVDASTPGVAIVKMSDGTARKVIQ